MKRFKLLSVMLAAVIAAGCAGLTGCKDKNSGSDAIRFYLWSDTGSTPAGFDEVVETFNEGAGKELGLQVQFSFDTQSDYKQKLNLSIASNQNDYDVVFDAAWIYLSEFAKKDYYYNLESYFNNDEYPGLKKAFSAEFLENNKFSGGVYGIPLTETFSDISIGYIRKDLRERCAADTDWTKPSAIASYNVTAADLDDGIDNFEELEYFLYWVKENTTGIVPALCNSDATWGAWDLINTRVLPSISAKQYADAGIKTGILIRQGMEASAYIRNGEVMAVDIADYLDPAASGGLNEFPSGFNVSDSKWQEDYTIARRWAEDGIISKDVMSTTDSQAKFLAGMGAVVVQTINNFGQVERQLAEQTPGATLEAYINDYAIREKMEGYARTDFKAWNYLCIPKSVPQEKVDKAMKFMNWLFESQDNHDLFQYGIRGKHWDVAKDESGNEIEGTVNTVGMEAYGFPAYELTWNSTYIRVQNASDPKIMEYSEYMYDIDRYVEIPYSEFTFDSQRTDELSSAVNNAAIGNGIDVAKQYYLGQVANPVASWNTVLSNRYQNASIKSAVAVIQREVKEQLQAYLDSLV